MVAGVMKGGSFTYEKDESKAYAMTFPEGTNPNNALFTDREYPSAVPKVNLTHPGVDITASGFRTPKSPARSTGTAAERRRIRRSSAAPSPATRASTPPSRSCLRHQCNVRHHLPRHVQDPLDEVRLSASAWSSPTPPSAARTCGKWNTDKLAWYNAADAERVLAKKEDACDDIIDQFILAATPSPRDIRAPLMAIMGFVVAALLVIT